MPPKSAFSRKRETPGCHLRFRQSKIAQMLAEEPTFRVADHLLVSDFNGIYAVIGPIGHLRDGLGMPIVHLEDQPGMLVRQGGQMLLIGQTRQIDSHFVQEWLVLARRPKVIPTSRQENIAGVADHVQDTQIGTPQEIGGKRG